MTLAHAHAWPGARRAHMSPMSVVRIVLPLAAALAAGPALAQTPPYPGPGPMVDPHRHQADQHRYEMDRLRAQADQREAYARQLQLESRINRLRLETARQPAPLQPPPLRRLRAPEQERADREAAAARRQATVEGLGQIDAWLDRNPK